MRQVFDLVAQGCETRIIIKGAELAPNQIAPLAPRTSP